MDTFSYNQGWQDGRNQGWVQGCDEGRLQGHHSGYRVGYNDGQQDGYRQGWDEGVNACNVEMRKQLEYTRGYVAEIEALKLEIQRLNALVVAKPAEKASMGDLLGKAKGSPYQVFYRK